MTETAGWGTPDWLPPGVQRRMAQESAREAREAKQAEGERERRTEERHQRALALYASRPSGAAKWSRRCSWPLGRSAAGLSLMCSLRRSRRGTVMT